MTDSANKKRKTPSWSEDAKKNIKSAMADLETISTQFFSAKSVEDFPTQSLVSSLALLIQTLDETVEELDRRTLISEKHLLESKKESGKNSSNRQGSSISAEKQVAALSKKIDSLVQKIKELEQGQADLQEQIDSGVIDLANEEGSNSEYDSDFSEGDSFVVEDGEDEGEEAETFSSEEDSQKLSREEKRQKYEANKKIKSNKIVYID